MRLARSRQMVAATRHRQPTNERVPHTAAPHWEIACNPLPHVRLKPPSDYAEVTAYVRGQLH
jgi:hypothetical protein